MPTEEQRERNRRKQKKWRDGHRNLVQARYRRRKLLRCEYDLRHFQGQFRTFELADPRDAPDPLPRLIGYCRTRQQPVWSALWVLRNVSNARWAMWFRELESVGLKPVELKTFAVGMPVPISLRFARQVVAFRVKMVCQAATGDPRNPPPWLCNEIRVGGKGYTRQIGRLLPDGTVQRFTSLREAARAVEASVDWIDHLAAIGGVDSGGSTWFDDQNIRP